MRKIVLIAHNLRSCHNVGSLLRTAEGLAVAKVFLTGYTPYPKINKETRLPHLAEKIDQQINKTALGAEKLIPFEHSEDVFAVLKNLSAEGYEICALEQTPNSIKLPEYMPTTKIAIIVGREVEGLEQEVLEKVDKAVEIPMLGQKESFNVVQAAAMALYHTRFTDYN